MSMTKEHRRQEASSMPLFHMFNMAYISHTETATSMDPRVVKQLLKELPRPRVHHTPENTYPRCIIVHATALMQESV